MDKINLIKKEIKDCKLYLNELYGYLKVATDSKEIKNLNDEINVVEFARDSLKDLVLAYDKGTGDSKLEEITKNNDEKIQYYQSLKDGLSDYDFEDFWKVKTLKDSLDIVNGNCLSKEEIYEFLNDYNEVMKLARENLFMPIGQVFCMYMNCTNQKYKANLDYYKKMIKIHIWFTNASILGVTKDEDFEYLWASDVEMGEKTKEGELSFLKDRFIIPTDATRFKKTHIFNFVRNAFFHSDSNELYKISPECNFITISLKQTNPIPFNIKLIANDLFRMGRSVRDYSHHVTAFDIENQEKIDYGNLFGDYEKCSKELDKLSLVRKILKPNGDDRKEDIHSVLNTSRVSGSQTLFNNTLAKYGDVTDMKYQFSEEQKKLYHSKFLYFNKYLGHMGLEHFVVPILVNYMPCGINKFNFLFLDAVIAYTYLFNWGYSVYEIMMDICNDYEEITMNGKLLNDKQSVFNLINQNIDRSKYGLLYLFDDQEKDNFNDVLLFKYVYGTVCKEEKVSIGGIEYSTEHIRNAFTHNRWRGFVNEAGKRCFYLYDDEDVLADPEKAYWSATILYDDLKVTMDEIMRNYCKSNQHVGAKTKKK